MEKINHSLIKKTTLDHTLNQERQELHFYDQVDKLIEEGESYINKIISSGLLMSDDPKLFFQAHIDLFKNSKDLRKILYFISLIDTILEWQIMSIYILRKILT